MIHVGVALKRIKYFINLAFINTISINYSILFIINATHKFYEIYYLNIRRFGCRTIRFFKGRSIT